MFEAPASRTDIENGAERPLTASDAVADPDNGALLEHKHGFVVVARHDVKPACLPLKTGVAQCLNDVTERQRFSHDSFAHLLKSDFDREAQALDGSRQRAYFVAAIFGVYRRLELAQTDSVRRAR